MMCGSGILRLENCRISDIRISNIEIRICAIYVPWCSGFTRPQRGQMSITPGFNSGSEDVQLLISLPSKNIDQMCFGWHGEGRGGVVGINRLPIINIKGLCLLQYFFGRIISNDGLNDAGNPLTTYWRNGNTTRAYWSDLGNKYVGFRLEDGKIYVVNRGGDIVRSI